MAIEITEEWVGDFFRDVPGDSEEKVTVIWQYDKEESVTEWYVIREVDGRFNVYYDSWQTGDKPDGVFDSFPLAKESCLRIIYNNLLDEHIRIENEMDEVKRLMKEDE